MALQPKFAEVETPFAVERALVGEHPAIVKLRALIERVAPTEVTVLITGESGTGKEVVAQAIHTLSPRSAQPFVPVNCAAIPHDLLESEMFGHERGAFTGAAGSRHGLLTTADRGTIFLDEIGEMPGALQAKLLRVLEDGVVRPVGADRGTRINVRHIAVLFKDGASVQEMLETYPHAQESWVHDAISYYLDHREEIEREIEANRIDEVLARTGGVMDDKGVVRFPPGKTGDE